MIHGSGNHICILSCGGYYFLPVRRLCVWVVFISHLNIPQKVPFKAEYHADAEYENPLKNSEKEYVCQRLLYPIMEKNNTLPY